MPRSALSGNAVYSEFPVPALEEAVAKHGKPNIFDTDQGEPIYQLRLYKRPAGDRKSARHAQAKIADTIAPRGQDEDNA